MDKCAAFRDFCMLFAAQLAKSDLLGTRLCADAQLLASEEGAGSGGTSHLNQPIMDGRSDMTVTLKLCNLLSHMVM